MSKVESSRPQYGIKEIKNVFFTMRDGVRLATDVYLPDVDCKYPALLSLAPYSKDHQRIGIPPQPVGSPMWDGASEAGDTDYFVPRGYVHVIADIRGTGASEGEYVGMFHDKEGIDGYDLVEEIAKQPWCDGNVGMLGMSYYGISQLVTAIEQPPHLKAICPYQTASDLYWSGYNGGILAGFMRAWFGVNVGSSGMAPRNISSVMIKTLSKEELAEKVEKAKQNPDLKNYSYLYSVLNNPAKNPFLFDLLLNPTNNEFYRKRSFYDRLHKIKTPMYVGAGWGATQLYIMAGTFDIYHAAQGPKKLMLTESSNPDRPFHQWHDEFLRWYDYWLKGIDNGVTDEKPIKRYITGKGAWQFEDEWPLKRMIWTKYYLRCRGRITRDPEPMQEVVPNAFVQEPLTVTTEAKSLQWATAPFINELQVAGPVSLTLHAEIDTDDTNWIVSLLDIDGGGNEKIITRGYLKASMRALDEKKSTPERPVHPFTTPEPVPPGEIVEYAIEILPVSHVFRPGHSLGLHIASVDIPPGYHFSFHLGSSKVTLHKVYADGKHPSHLLLPVVDDDGR